MSYFIECIKDHQSIKRDVKELIPNMNIRRRMSRVVKMGVTTALDSLADFEQEGGCVDAIITATWLGCIADSEKFLANIIENREQMLNPTPFIQSTFNTVGAQIALIRSLKCYNNTFTHRHDSLKSAMIDAVLQLECCGARGVLVGWFDELTPTVETLCRRLKIAPPKDGATFFVMSKESYSHSAIEVDEGIFRDLCSSEIDEFIDELTKMG